jgi:hypothetical protein
LSTDRRICFGGGNGGVRLLMSYASMTATAAAGGVVRPHHYWYRPSRDHRFQRRRRPSPHRRRDAVGSSDCCRQCHGAVIAHMAPALASLCYRVHIHPTSASVWSTRYLSATLSRARSSTQRVCTHALYWCTRVCCCWCERRRQRARGPSHRRRRAARRMWCRPSRRLPASPATPSRCRRPRAQPAATCCCCAMPARVSSRHVVHAVAWRRCCACACLCGVRCAVCGVRCAVCGVRCAVCGVRCAVCGVRCAV